MCRPVGGTVAPPKYGWLVWWQSEFEKWDDWAGFGWLFFLLPRTVWGDNWKFQGLLQNFSICSEKCPILCLELKHNFGTEWNGKRCWFWSPFGTRFQMLHHITIEEVKVWLCFFFSLGGDAEIQHVCSCVVACTKGVSSLICERTSGDAGWSTGERRALEKSTPDCWLFLCTILRQCALHGRLQAIHWPSQYPSLNSTPFSLLLFPPCFPQFPHFSFSLFQFIYVPTYTVNLYRNKLLKGMYTLSREKCAP